MKVYALNHQNLYLALVHVTKFGTDFFILIFFPENFVYFLSKKCALNWFPQFLKYSE